MGQLDRRGLHSGVGAAYSARCVEGGAAMRVQAPTDAEAAVPRWWAMSMTPAPDSLPMPSRGYRPPCTLFGLARLCFKSITLRLTAYGHGRLDAERMGEERSDRGDAQEPTQTAQSRAAAPHPSTGTTVGTTPAEAPDAALPYSARIAFAWACTAGWPLMLLVNCRPSCRCAGRVARLTTVSITGAAVDANCALL